MELIVRLNGYDVAKLKKGNNGSLSFKYLEKWLQTPRNRPLSFSLPLSEKEYSGDIVENFFDNLLPDSPLIRTQIQQQLKIKSKAPFDLLKAIGRDCIGAIQLVLEENEPFEKKIVGTNLSDKDVNKILTSHNIYPLGMSRLDDSFRISLAGQQIKTALLFYNGNWMKPVGATPTTHILKPPIGKFQYSNMDLNFEDSCENEFICLKIAEQFGLKVPRCEVLNFDDQKVLSVERFDRRLANDKKWIVRIPQEDFCQALGVSAGLKYQSDGGPGISKCMHFLRASSFDNDRDEFFKAQMVFWLLAAPDGHAKNFSIFIEENNSYRMTPLYDIISAYPLMSKKGIPKQSLKMAMCLISSKNYYDWIRFQPRYFISTAKRVGYSEKDAKNSLEYLFDNVDKVIEKVESMIPKNFPEETTSKIFIGMKETKNSNPLNRIK